MNLFYRDEKEKYVKVLQAEKTSHRYEQSNMDIIIIRDRFLYHYFACIQWRDHQLFLPYDFWFMQPGTGSLWILCCACNCFL
jgi:hypothetical protein